MNNLIEYDNFSIKESQNYSYGCVMFYFDPTNDFLKTLREEISEDDLYTEDNGDSFGLEIEPHVTSLYGLYNDIDDIDIINVCKEFNTPNVKFLNLSLFENDKFDVVKINVDGDTLNEMHNKLKEFPNDDNYPEYQPHITLAYVKKGKGKKYTKKLDERELKPTHIVYSKADKDKISIQFKDK